nr:hypothetical protein [uncultured Roseateles sp.]
MTVETNKVIGADPAAPEVARVVAARISNSPFACASSLVPTACHQTSLSTVPSATLQVAMVTGADMMKADLLALFRDWMLDARQAPGSGPDEIVWFISKRATALINTWLNNRKLSGLHTNGASLGPVVISRDRIEHVRGSRLSKDSVSAAGVVELLAALFIQGVPKYAPHPDGTKYPAQLLMFDPVYKAKNAAASGESPVAALQFIGAPVAHLRLETAYWANPGKTKALDEQALRKPKNDFATKEGG